MLLKIVKGLLIGLVALVGLLLLLPVAVMLLFLMTEMFDAGVRSIPFDVEQHGVLDVIVRNHHGEDDTLYYYNLSDDGRAQQTEPFEPDAMTVTRIDRSSLESYVDRGQNKVLNRLQEVYVCDDNGNRIPNTDPLVDAVMHQAAKLEHDIMELRMLQTGGETFLYTELNVNLWCPCELYWYDPVEDRLVELYTFNELEVVGLRVRDVGRVKRP